MKIVFAGTPPFAATALAALHDAGIEIALVLSQPDRPAGRGLQLQASAVKGWALAHGMPVIQPRSLRLDGRYPGDAVAARAALAAADAEAMVVAAYGLILPSWVLETPPLGCFNIHASLLPRWRGAAPIQRAIEAGDAETGITIMQMDAGLDTGDMLLAESLPIAGDDTAARLHDRLAPLGGRLIVSALRQAERGGLVRTPQPNALGVTYASKIEKAEAAIDWSAPASLIERRMRAFDPFPGATTWLEGEPIKCWRAQAVPGAGVAGTVLAADESGIQVACGDGALRLTELQRPGGKRLPAGQFLQGRAVVPGSVFAATGPTRH